MIPHEEKLKEGHNEKRKLKGKIIMKTKLTRIRSRRLFLLRKANHEPTRLWSEPAFGERNPFSLDMIE